MRTAILVIGVFLILTSSLWGDSLSLNYTVAGYGGTSSPVAGVSDSPFWWAGTGAEATVPGSVLTSYGFDPLAGIIRGITPDPFSHNGLYSGSLLLSSPFTLTNEEQLSVTFNALAGRYFSWGNFEFAVLLKNSQLAAILGIVSPMSMKSTSDEPYPGTVFSAPSSGVTMNADKYWVGYPEEFQLGSSQFGGEWSHLDCASTTGTPCQNKYTSIYSPGAGTYQLLFGAFYATDNGPTAVAVQSVQVPEEGTAPELLIGATGLIILVWKLRKTAGEAQHANLR